MAGPTQPQVIDEVWDDTRIKSFLELSVSGDDPLDFKILLGAYRGMRPGDFERFLNFFSDKGHNLDETDNKGRTIWEIISAHRHGKPYLDAMEKHRNG